MSKIEFENEDQIKDFYDNVISKRPYDGGMDNLESWICRIKKYKYIKKSELEIAKEEWEEIRVDNRIDFSGTYLRRLKIADNLINLQQNEIERLKNAN